MARGARVFGISSDPVESHARFAAAESLPFTLLSDVDGTARAAFGVPRQLLGLAPGRVTFVVDRDRRIAAVHSSALGIAGHVEAACEAVRRLQDG